MASPTAGFRQPPLCIAETMIIAKRVSATAKQPKKPSKVGDVFLVLTIKFIITKMKVQVISI
jgi:hypothetical protein